MFDTEKCCVEIEFKACFRNSLRYGLYSSCGRDKLSEAGEFYLHYLARMQSVALLFLCVGACRIARVVLNSARHSVFCTHCEFCSASGALVMHIIQPLPCATGIDTVRVAPASWCCVLRQSVRSFTCCKVPHRLQSLGTARLSRFTCAIELGSLASALAYAPPCVFYRACVTQRPMGAAKF